MGRSRAKPVENDAALVRAWLLEHPGIKPVVSVPLPGTAFLVALYDLGDLTLQGLGGAPWLAAAMHADLHKALLQAINEWETG